MLKVIAPEQEASLPQARSKQTMSWEHGCAQQILRFFCNRCCRGGLTEKHRSGEWNQCPTPATSAESNIRAKVKWLERLPAPSHNAAMCSLRSPTRWSCQRCTEGMQRAAAIATAATVCGGSDGGGGRGSCSGRCLRGERPGVSARQGLADRSSNTSPCYSEHGGML